MKLPKNKHNLNARDLVSNHSNFCYKKVQKIRYLMPYRKSRT